MIYTTNIMEGLNRQFRQITKNKLSFTNDDSLRKMLYPVTRKIVEHWTARPPETGLTIVFPGRQTAFTLCVHTVSHSGTQVGKHG